MAGPIADTGHMGDGDTNDQGPGAAQNQDGDGQLQVSGQGPDQEGDDQDGRGIVLGEAVDKALGLRFGVLGFFHQFNDSAKGSILAYPVGQNLQGSIV